MSKRFGGKHSGKHSASPEDDDPELSKLAQHTQSGQPVEQSVRPEPLLRSGSGRLAEHTERTEQSVPPGHPEDTEHTEHSDPSQHPDQLPQRRSISERLAVMDQSSTAQVAGLDASPLTMTTTALRLSNTSIFGISSTGQVTVGEAAAPIAQNLHVGSQGSQGQPLDRETAETHHLLIVGEDVSADELEALAVSIWDDAGWINPGVLSLGAGGQLLGWWHIEEDVRHALYTPADLTRAWVLDCPTIRGKAPDQVQQARDHWAHAFPDGMPVGVELKTLLALERMARRLAGAIRISASGDLITPDADSAVDLRIYSPRWVGPEDLAQALRLEFPDVLDSRDVQPDPVAQKTTAQSHYVAQIKRHMPPVPQQVQPPVPQQIQQLVPQPANGNRVSLQPQVVDGYALLAHVGNRSTMMVEVHSVPRPPRVLRWESWPSGVVVEYALRWLPQGRVDGPRSGLTRTERLERIRSATGIELAASILVEVAGGLVVDEDGFLVGVDQV